MYVSCLLIDKYILSLICLARMNSIGDVMVSVLVSSAVDCWFDVWSGQTKDYKIGICCFFAKHTALNKEREQRLVGLESG